MRRSGEFPRLASSVMVVGFIYFFFWPTSVEGRGSEKGGQMLVCVCV